MLQFERDGKPVFVLLIDLGSSSAKYQNKLLSPDRVRWASEKKMNVRGQRARALLSSETTVFLFGRRPRGQYFFLGRGTPERQSGSTPFSVEFRLPTALPTEILCQLSESAS